VLGGLETLTTRNRWILNLTMSLCFYNNTNTHTPNIPMQPWVYLMYAECYFVKKFKSTKKADSSSFAAHAARATVQVAASIPFQNSVMWKRHLR
jgi:hypothetical protein